MAERQCAELFAPADEQCIGSDHEPVGPQLGQGCEYRIEVALGAGVQDMELQPEGAGRRLQVFRYGLCNKGAGRVDEKRNDVRRGYQLAQQFQPLRPQLRVHVGHAGDIAARSVEAGDKSSRDRISSDLEYDGNRRGRRLCRKRRRRTTGRSNHGHLTANQIGRQCRQSIILAVRPAVFDRDVSALDIAGFAQALAKRAQAIARTVQTTRCRGTRSPASPAAARAPPAASLPLHRREA